MPLEPFVRIISNDGDVILSKSIRFSESLDNIFLELQTSTPWQQKSININGRDVKEPRLTAWYGDLNTVYTYSGITNIPLSWTPLLLNMKNTLQEDIGAEFNSVLLNYYRSGNDSIGFHSDDEPELGPYPTIASVSLGATRSFVFRSKYNRKNQIPVFLNHGDTLIMSGETQLHWKHGIDKTVNTGPRINLTFRKVFT